jgi:hypothetical protein
MEAAMVVTRRRVLAAAAAAALGVCGCGSDLGSIAYFLTPEHLEPPEIKKLSVDEKDHSAKVPRVLILPYVSLDIAQTEFLGADGQLAEALAKQMQAQCEANQEKVTIVPWLKVKEYLSRRPNWRVDLEPDRAGEDFHADYVIVLDVSKLSLYEPGSHNTIYRGVADLTVLLADVKHPDEPVEQRELHFTYPSEARPVEADMDTPPPVFKKRFFEYLGKRLAWHFIPHHKREAYYVD